MDADRCIDKHVHKNMEVLTDMISKANLESLLRLDMMQSNSGPLKRDSPRSRESLRTTQEQHLGENNVQEPMQSSSTFSSENEPNAIGRVHMWWIMMQDQLGTFVKEIDSLRASNASMQARLTEDLVCRTESTAELKQGITELLLQQTSLKQEMETSKEKYDCAMHKLSELLQVERSNNAKTRESIAELRSDLQGCLDARSSHLENSFKDQVCQLQRLMGTFSQDLRMEVDLRTVANDQVVRDIVSLQQAHERQISESHATFQELHSKVSSLLSELSAERQESAQRQSALQAHELIQKTISEKIASEKHSREELARTHEKTIRDMDSELSSQVASLRVDISAVREDCAQRQSSLQAYIANYFGEQHECIQNMISEKLSEERKAREESMQRMLVLLDTDRESVRSDRESNRCQALSLENQKTELDMLRTAMTEMVSKGRAREECIKNEFDSLKESLASYSIDIKALEKASAERLSFQLQLQDQVSSERQLREQALAEFQIPFLHDSITELKNDIAGGCESCACKAIDVKQEVAACFEALKDIITEERASRIDALKNLEDDLKNRNQGPSLNEIKELIAEMCTQEQAPAQTTCSPEKQTMDSEEELRQKLRDVLHSDIVTKRDLNEVTNTIDCLLQSVKIGGVVKDPSSCNTTPDRERPARKDSIRTRRGVRGSSPLLPNQASVATIASAHAAPFGSFTPRNLQLSEGALGRHLPRTSRSSKQSLR